jgi:hypothetical protein
MEHKMYRANSVAGQRIIPFAKCLCGAHLIGQQEIEEHEALVRNG